MTSGRELAILIERGLTEKDVTEAVECFFEEIHGRFYVCALGLALVGKYQTALRAFENIEQATTRLLEMNPPLNFTVTPDYLYLAATLLEIDYALAEEINTAHLHGLSAEMICFQLGQTEV